MLFLANNLNLLPVLVVIGEELNLSKAAKRLRISQPAVSQALSHLRKEFDDELFVRGSSGMVPTPRGLALVLEVRQKLSSLQDVYLSQENDLALFRGNIVIASTTYFEVQIIHFLTEKIRQASPMAKLFFLPLTGELPKTELEQGRIDIAIAAYFSDLPEGLRSVQVHKEDHVCVTRKAHPFLQLKDKFNGYLEASHLKIDVPPGSTPLVDVELKRKGLARNIGLHISNFMTPPMTLGSTDLILTCPRSLGEHYCKQYDLVMSELPIQVPLLEVTMIWHERSHDQPIHRFVRSLVTSWFTR